jgi:membrane-associated protease RseP (regulator of RpoE activity)
MLGASETPYDLRFRLFDIPVRVHPVFWLISAALGWHNNNLPLVAAWVGCVFVSILVHEYGHGLTAKAFGASPSIVLWGLGGLCYSQTERQTAGQRLAVVLMGPGAGFILCAVVMIGMSLIFGVSPREHLDTVAELLRIGPGSDTLRDTLTSPMVRDVYRFLVWINLMWGLVNLMPIWPLDGGRVSEILLSWYDRSRGLRWSHVLSLLVSGVLAVVAITLTQDLFLTIFFGYFAMVNFQVLQTLHQAQSMGLYHDDEWWRR